jgi:hypothetical protein
MKTQKIISNSYVHNSFNTLYIPTTKREMINENSIKKRMTARSHDLVSESISALFGGKEENHKKPSARITSVSQDLNLDFSTQNTSAAHLSVIFNKRKTVRMQICPVHYPILIIIIITIFSTLLYVNYTRTCPDNELHTSDVQILNNVIVPYNVL